MHRIVTEFVLVYYFENIIKQTGMVFSIKSYKNTSDNNEDCYTFHKNEILPDYQERMRIWLTKLQTVPNISPKHIGMKKINGKTASEKYFIDFASKATIHGLNHLVAPRRHLIERILMTLFIVGNLICLIFVSLNFWNRYQNEATIQILDVNQKNFQIHKPALLICSMKKIDETKFGTIFQRYNIKDTPETRDFFQFLSNINYETMHETPDFDEVAPEKWLQILYDLRYEFHPIFRDIENATLSWVITERGICLSMRNYVSVYNTLEYWLADNWTIVPTPQIMPFYDNNKDSELETIIAMTSIAVTVYDPGEMIEYQHKRIEISSLMLGLYQFLITECVTGWRVNELSVKQRNCKLKKDKGLKIWPVYTLKMCMIECRYKTIRQSCGCLPHFARSIADVPVCNAAQLRCIASIKDNLFLHKYVPARCNCLPNCNHIRYDVDSYNIVTLKNDSHLNISVLDIATTFPSLMIRREEIFGFTEFLIAIGGAAGLFLGASVLSFIEIFYYSTLHILLYLIKRKR